MVEGAKKEGPEVTIFVEPGRVREARRRSGEQVARVRYLFVCFFFEGLVPRVSLFACLLFRDFPLCVVF